MENYRLSGMIIVRIGGRVFPVARPKRSSGSRLTQSDITRHASMPWKIRMRDDLGRFRVAETGGIR